MTFRHLVRRVRRWVVERELVRTLRHVERLRVQLAEERLRTAYEESTK